MWHYCQNDYETNQMQEEIKDILKENKRRIDVINAVFDPLTGQGSTGERTKVHISGMPTPDMWLPNEMPENTFISELIECGSVRKYIKKLGFTYNQEVLDYIVEGYIRVRIKYDFPFWAYLLFKIKPKGGGDDVPFKLNRPQRKLVNEGFCNTKILHEPVRLIILKARQWGGSTCTDAFCAWLQLVHGIGLNSLICAQVKDAANEVLDMFYRGITSYPVRLLHNMGEEYRQDETKWCGVGNSTNIHRVPQRKCKVKIGTAEKPDSCRGGDYNLVHCTEVGVWKKTDGKEPEDIIDAATSGILLKAFTLIVYESTAKGTGNFFHREWVAAKNGTSQFSTIFVAWYEIDQYSMEFKSEDEKADFAVWLWENRFNENTMSDREEPGKYLWWLWEKGATLEAINWYIQERRKYRDHGHMASEYPSDDVEAFVHSGARVFDKYAVETFRKDCRSPLAVGDIYGRDVKGEDCLKDVHFAKDNQGLLWIWQYPEIFPDERVLHRYLVTVDIGGRGNKSDWSVITVFDRFDMMYGGNPSVVAQWRGHIDHDLLAWKAAQIAKWYDNALLVIESNTLETKDKDRQVDGDQSGFILNKIKNIYDNLYSRQSTDEDAVVEGAENKYGFHTNVNTKPKIISLLIEIIRDHLYIERDSRCLDEYLTYELKEGVYAAISGCHDDMLMTRAIGLWICYREMPLPVFQKISKENYISYGSNV